MKKICVITSSRADYGLLKHLLKEIKVSSFALTINCMWKPSFFFSWNDYQ